MLLCEINHISRSILVRNYCQVSSCGARDIVRVLLLETTVQNYNYIVAPLDPMRDSLQVYTTTREQKYFYDAATSGVFVRPELEPSILMMPSPEVLRTNNIVNKKVSWVFNIKTSKNLIPAGTSLRITLPARLMVPLAFSSVTVTNYDTGTPFPNTSTSLTPDGTSITSIFIPSVCPQATQATLPSCLVGSAFSF